MEGTAELIYSAIPRGLGSDWTPGCYCCGGEYGLYSNCSFFVRSREVGEFIVSLFTTGARLDYRDYEPNWIQVKVGVCAKHVPNLEHLIDRVIATQDQENGPGINSRMIRESQEIPS